MVKKLSPASPIVKSQPAVAGESKQLLPAPIAVQSKSNVSRLQRVTVICNPGDTLVEQRKNFYRQKKLPNQPQNLIRLIDEHGIDYVGKTTRDRSLSVQEKHALLQIEFAAYQHAYEKFDDCQSNLAKAVGIVYLVKSSGLGKFCLTTNSVPRVVPLLLIEEVPGLSGEKFFSCLHDRWQKKKIPDEAYWNAIRFVMQTLLNLALQLRKAGLVHCDVKPPNLIFSSETGELTLIDFEFCVSIGSPHVRCTEIYAAPEQNVLLRQATDVVDNSTDLFGIASTLLDAVEQPDLLTRAPANGFLHASSNSADIPDSCNAIQRTRFIQLIKSMQQFRQSDRPSAEQALQSPFLIGTPLDVRQARQTIKSTMEGVQSSIPNAAKKVPTIEALSKLQVAWRRNRSR